MKVTTPDGTVIQYQYDADGNRDANGAVGAYFVRAGNQLLSVIRGSDVRYYISDGLGSVRELRDASGTTTDSYLTTAYGESLARTGTDARQYGFAGEAIDQLAGLSYNRAKWMDPRTGTFLSMDL